LTFTKFEIFSLKNDQGTSTFTSSLVARTSYFGCRTCELV